MNVIIGNKYLTPRGVILTHFNVICGLGKLAKRMILKLDEAI
jgi:hypothetical protein